MKYVEKEQVVKEFKELLPWDKVDTVDEILYDIGENSIEDYLFKKGGYLPFDFINAEKCVEHYGVDTLCDEMDDYELGRYLEEYPSRYSTYTLIEALKEKWDLYGEIQFSETNISALSELLKEIRKSKSKKKK